MIQKNKLKKVEWSIFIFTILYTILFGFYFFNLGNLEFLWYVGVLVFITILISSLHMSYRFPSSVLFGISLWGFLHMIGGLRIGGMAVYARMIYPLVSSEIAGTDIFRYDQFMHFYVYVVVTFLLFHILNFYFKDNMNKKIFLVFVVCASIGVGAINEIVEFMPVLFLENTGVGDYFNTLWDLVFNTLGAIVAALYLGFKK